MYPISNATSMYLPQIACMLYLSTRCMVMSMFVDPRKIGPAKAECCCQLHHLTELTCKRQRHLAGFHARPLYRAPIRSLNCLSPSEVHRKIEIEQDLILLRLGDILR